MDITVKKIKLTKSVLNQLPLITAAQMLTAKPLGYVLNCRKGIVKCLILTDGHGYFVLAMRVWSKYLDLGLRAGTRTRRFNSTKERDDWLNQYKNLVAGAEQVFL